jgi:hypothetical protein
MSSNSLVLEIRDAFANLTPGKRARLSSLPVEYPAWVYSGTANVWGVAIAAGTLPHISERFSSARLYTEGGAGAQELRLECGGGGYRNEFAVVCAQFLEPGLNEDDRGLLLGHPSGWRKRWRELLGNAIKQKRPYGVIGELLAFERLLAAGEDPEWLGPVSNSHDIEAKAASYEVKSTVSKYSSTFHVASQYQLRETEGKELSIVHQRFEPSPSGHSIDSVVARLKSAGHDITQVESALSRLGYELGSSDRKLTYQLLQSTQYIVGAGFPRITDSDFVGGLVPNGVIALEYDVDLAGVPGTPFL